jgi:hypothetical protein
VGEINPKTFEMIKFDNHHTNEEAFIQDFTTKHYRELLKLARLKYKLVSYENISFAERFILWRHDCDFSLNRAFKIAEIEMQEGVTSTYFVNPHSEFYNLLEARQAKLVEQILGMGHSLGLHFDAGFYKTRSKEELEEQISSEVALVEGFFGGKLFAFSFHNPNEALLAYEEDSYGGLLNCYSRKFKEEIPYCSDSNGYWRFRRLREVLETGEDFCLQVLTHPGWWQEQPMLPMERVDRCIRGRSSAIQNQYVRLLQAMGRENIGYN